MLSRLARPFAAAAASCLAALLLVSCGGGGVSAAPSPIVDSPTVTILPGTGTVLYSGLPTTFILSGGTGAYIVTSSNQAVLAISGGVTGRSVTLVPNPVTTDTHITLTVRDTGSAEPVTADVTVKPGTVNNAITITPTSTQGGSCAPAICSGSDAEVSVTLSQGGIPLPARGVRFEVVSGDFSFVNTAPGTAPEELATSVITTTDETGKARARIRVRAAAPNQTAILQVTDLGSLAYQRANFVIAQFTDGTASLFTIPTSVTFTGPRVGFCASGVVAEIFIFGGTPPYTVANPAPSLFAVSPTVVNASGGRFSVAPIGGGACSGPTEIFLAITDSAGRTLGTVKLINTQGTTPVPPIAVAPSTLILNNCSMQAAATVTGGLGTYLPPNSSDSGVLASVVGNTLTVQRLKPSAAIVTTPVLVTVSDGLSVATLNVSVNGAGAGVCTPTSP